MSGVERFQRIEALFREASHLDEPAREALLRDRCGDDKDLLRDALALCRADRRPPGVLDEPAFGVETIRASLHHPPADTTAPERIGHYRILRVIGEGGMGTVYEAEQDNPRRRVALKVIRAGVVSRQIAQRFRQEAHILGRLQHKGIAQVLEAGAFGEGRDERPYFAMEYVQGQPLLEHAASPDMSVRDKVEIVAALCDAVQHAHDQGVIHRDLKPANILVVVEKSAADRLERVCQPKILDFGVARATNSDVQAVTLQTSMGELIGTVPYMSPEQAAGNPAEIDWRCDIYALGVILFELLSGRLPHEVRDLMVHEALRVIRESDATRLGSLDRSFRGDIEVIVDKALAHEKERRYQSAAEFAADLRRYLHDEPVKARPASTAYQLQKFARRNKALVTGVAIAFLALSIATIVSIWQARTAIRAQRFADERAAAALRQAARASVASAAVALQQGDPRYARSVLDSVDQEHRHWEFAHLQSQLSQYVATIELESPVRAAGFADNDAVVVATSDGAIRRFNLDGIAHPDGTRSVGETLAATSLSADGRLLVGACGEAQRLLKVWDATTGRELHRAGPFESALRVVAISSDGACVAAASRTQVYLWNPASGVQAPPIGLVNPTALAFSGNQQRIAIAYNPGSSGLQGGWAAVFEAGTATTVMPGKRTTPSNAVCLDLDANGARLAVGQLDKTLTIRDVATRAVSHALVGHAGNVVAVALPDASDRLFSATSDQTLRAWNVEHGTLETTFMGVAPRTTAMIVSDDGSKGLTIAGQQIRIWDFSPDRVSGRLRGHSSYVYDVAFLDNARFASGGWDGTVRAWDAVRRTAIADWKPGGNVYSIAVSTQAGIMATAHQDRISLWNAHDFQHRSDIRLGLNQRVTSVSLSRDGSRLAIRTEHLVIVRDIARNVELERHDLSSRTQYCKVAISPDGLLLAADGPSKDIVIWRIGSGEPPRRLLGHRGPVCALRFNSDGTLLASGSHDATARLWSVSDGRQLHVLTGHSDNVYAVAFSPDSARLATGSNDTTVRLWDVATGEFAAQLDGHVDYVFALAFSPDGSMLVSGSGDSTAHLWDTLSWSQRRAQAGPTTQPVPKSKTAP